MYGAEAGVQLGKYCSVDGLGYGLRIGVLVSPKTVIAFHYHPIHLSIGKVAVLHALFYVLIVDALGELLPIRFNNRLVGVGVLNTAYQADIVAVDSVEGVQIVTAIGEDRVGNTGINKGEFFLSCKQSAKSERNTQVSIVFSCDYQGEGEGMGFNILGKLCGVRAERMEVNGVKRILYKARGVRIIQIGIKGLEGREVCLIRFKNVYLRLVAWLGTKPRQGA